jgi:hypothetical protein
LIRPESALGHQITIDVQARSVLARVRKAQRRNAKVEVDDPQWVGKAESAGRL